MTMSFVMPMLLLAMMPVMHAHRALLAYPTCSGKPTQQNSSPDASGYLWGSNSCQFKNSDGSLMYYRALISAVGASAVSYSKGPSSLPPVGINWLDQPRCKYPPTNTNGADWFGHLWGYENGHSCVFRTPAGFPILPKDVQAGKAASIYDLVSDHLGGYMHLGLPPSPASSAAVSWSTARACPQAPDGTAQKDASGLLWGWANGASCAFRDAKGNPVYPSTTGSSSSSGGSSSGGGGGDWRTIPACPMAPTWSDALDSYGHLWGWAGGRSCAFRDAKGNPIYPSTGR